MYLAFSALNTTEQNNQEPSNLTNESELHLRYRAYQSTCQKYSGHIAEIQKYLPNWKPKFR